MRRNNNATAGFERTGIVYGSYFARAIFREFKPDLDPLSLLASCARSGLTN